MRKFSYLLSILLLGLSGCGSIKGFYSGYKRLSTEQTAQVVLLVNEASIPEDKTKIYAITANAFTKSIAELDTVIVYRWSAHCSSESCIPIYVAETYCKQKNYHLYILADYYDDLLFKQLSKTSNPLLAVNHKYYGTDRVTAYGNKFEKEVDQQRILNKSNNYFRFMVFEKGKLVAVKDKLK